MFAVVGSCGCMHNIVGNVYCTCKGYMNCGVMEPVSKAQNRDIYISLFISIMEICLFSISRRFKYVFTFACPFIPTLIWGIWKKDFFPSCVQKYTYPNSENFALFSQTFCIRNELVFVLELLLLQTCTYRHSCYWHLNKKWPYMVIYMDFKWVKRYVCQLLM